MFGLCVCVCVCVCARVRARARVCVCNGLMSVQSGGGVWVFGQAWPVATKACEAFFRTLLLLHEGG